MSNKYENLSLAKIENSIKRKNDLIQKYQITEVIEDKDLSAKIEAEEAELDLLLDALEKKEQKPMISNGTGGQSYERSLKIVELNNAFKSVKSFGPGVSSEDFVESLDQKYKIFVKPNLREYPYLEAEYVKMCLDSMHPTYVQQALNTGGEMKSFEDFKSYITKVHGTKQSNFQILNKCFTLQHYEGESYNDYAARLDISFRQAATRIISRHKAQKKTSENPNPVVAPEVVFELAGALVMAQMVRQTNKPIYDQMCRKMDEYEDAIKVGAEAQKLYDRGVRPDDNVETVHFGSNGGTGKYVSSNGQSKVNNVNVNNRAKGDSGNRSSKPSKGKPHKKSGNTKGATNPDGTCKWGDKCFRYAKGTCPHPHTISSAHVAEVDKAGNSGNTYNGYTYADFRN